MSYMLVIDDDNEELESTSQKICISSDDASLCSSKTVDVEDSLQKTMIQVESVEKNLSCIDIKQDTAEVLARSVINIIIQTRWLGSFARLGLKKQINQMVKNPLDILHTDRESWRKASKLLGLEESLTPHFPVSVDGDELLLQTIADVEILADLILQNVSSGTGSCHHECRSAVPSSIYLDTASKIYEFLKEEESKRLAYLMESSDSLQVAAEQCWERIQESHCHERSSWPMLDRNGIVCTGVKDFRPCRQDPYETGQRLRRRLQRNPPWSSLCERKSNSLLVPTIQAELKHTVHRSVAYTQSLTQIEADFPNQFSKRSLNSESEDTVGLSSLDDATVETPISQADSEFSNHEVKGRDSLEVSNLSPRSHDIASFIPADCSDSLKMRTAMDVCETRLKSCNSSHSTDDSDEVKDGRECSSAQTWVDGSFKDMSRCRASVWDVGHALVEGSKPAISSQPTSERASDGFDEHVNFIAEIVRPSGVHRGQLSVNKAHILFCSETADMEEAEHGCGDTLNIPPKWEGPAPRNRKIGGRKQWSTAQIIELHGRRYVLLPSALEIIFSDGQSAFINFPQGTDVARRVYQRLVSLAAPYIRYHYFDDPEKALQRYRLTENWVSGRISNFEYLMQLNSFAGRTYNDLEQYFVMPWVLRDYSADSVDLSDPESYRNFAWPIAAQSEERRAQFKARFRSWQDPEIPKFHYGSHYSSTAIVLWYLLRLEPFSGLALDFQGGQFDCADRMFRSIAEACSGAGVGMNDVKELIPEFFYLPDFLVNAERLDLGCTQSRGRVDDVLLPPWAKGSPLEFVRIHRQVCSESKDVDLYVIRTRHCSANLLKMCRRWKVTMCLQICTFGLISSSVTSSVDLQLLRL